jgi:hypothetical protein
MYVRTCAGGLEGQARVCVRRYVQKLRFACLACSLLLKLPIFTLPHAVFHDISVGIVDLELSSKT